MVREVTLYQTKSNHEKYEANKNAPLFCNDHLAWSGEGYYFWESHEKLAHWWGVTHYKKKYVVAQAQADITLKCLDLHNDYNHQLEITNIWHKLEKEKKLSTENTTLASVIQFLKQIGAFNYEGIRFSGINSVGERNTLKKYRSRIPVTNSNPLSVSQKKYLDLCPPIQVCLLSEKSLNFRNYQLIFDSSKKDDN